MTPASGEPLKGEIHGSTIRLISNPGLPDGQQVEVIVRPTESVDANAASERIAAYKGLEDWSEEDDRILKEIANSRREATWRNPEEHE